VEEGAHGVRTQADVDVLEFKLSIGLKVPAMVPAASCHPSDVDIHPGLVFVLVVLDELVDEVLKVEGFLVARLVLRLLHELIHHLIPCWNRVLQLNHVQDL
jgi:hypothetical protein